MPYSVTECLHDALLCMHNASGLVPSRCDLTSQTPGEYLRRCRLNAGMTVMECAERIAIHHADRARAADDLTALEANEPGDYGRLIRHLRARAVFPFDFATFATLAAATCDPTLDELEAA